MSGECLRRRNSDQILARLPVVVFCLLGASGPAAAQTGLVTSTLKVDSPVISLAVDSQTGQIFAGSGDIILVFDNELKERMRLQPKMGFVHDLEVIGDQLLAAGGDPGESGAIEVFSIANGQSLWRKSLHRDSMYSLSSANGQLLTASADGRCRRLNLDSQEPELEFAEHSKQVTRVSWIGSGPLAVSGGLDDTIRVWDGTNGKLKRTLKHHQDDVLDMATRMPEKGLPQLVTVSRDRTVRFWQPTIGRMMRFRKLDGVPQVCLWETGTEHVIVGTELGQVFAIDSMSLEVELLAELEQPVISMVALRPGAWVVGTESEVCVVERPTE